MNAPRRYVVRSRAGKLLGFSATVEGARDIAPGRRTAIIDTLAPGEDREVPSSPPTSRGPLSVLAGDGWATVLAPADAAAAALRLSRGHAVVVVRVGR